MTRPFLLMLVLLTAVGQAQELPDRLLQESGLSGGLVVVVDGGYPALLAGLRASEAFTVTGLERDPVTGAKARTFLGGRELHGPVTALTWMGQTLPFTDNLANLLVVVNGAPAQAETERVLAPGGVCLRLRAAASARSRTEARSAWERSDRQGARG